MDRSHPLDFQTLFLAGMALGGDFRKVLVHTGPEADEKARSIGAEAFTSGQDIYFREGQYDPESGEGRKRLIHELTHTSQFAEQRDMGFREDRAVLEEEAALREAQIDEAGLHRMELDEWVSGCDEEELIRVIGREGQIYLFTEEELEEVKEEALERIADWISSEWFTFDEKKKIRIMDYLYGNRWY